MRGDGSDQMTGRGEIMRSVFSGGFHVECERIILRSEPKHVGK